MNRSITQTLTREFGSYEIVRTLHDVPPHEVHEVSVNGRRAVLKVDTGPTGNAGTEGRVIEFVSEHTTVPVPEIMSAGEDYFVAAWHPAAPQLDQRHGGSPTWARAAGRAIANLHNESESEIEGYGQFRVEDPELILPGNGSWQTAAIEYVESHRSLLEDIGQDDLLNKVVEFLGENSHCFDGVDGPVCCHGWATPEHVSVSGSRVGCMVDFEHAIAAPGEFDYWRTVFPTFDSDAAELQMFRDSYESVRALPTGVERRKPLYSILHGIYYFESLYVQDQHGPEETEKRAQRIRSSIIENLNRLS